MLRGEGTKGESTAPHRLPQGAGSAPAGPLLGVGLFRLPPRPSAQPRPERRRRDPGAAGARRGGGMAVLWALPAPLSPAQLKRLEQHRYSSAGRSLLEPWLQPYWGWLVEQVPLGLAPNAITLGGLLLNCLTALPLIAYCPSATEQVPPATAPPLRERLAPSPARHRLLPARPRLRPPAPRALRALRRCGCRSSAGVSGSARHLLTVPRAIAHRACRFAPSPR